MNEGIFLHNLATFLVDQTCNGFGSTNIHTTFTGTYMFRVTIHMNLAWETSSIAAVW